MSKPQPDFAAISESLSICISTVKAFPYSCRKIGEQVPALFQEWGQRLQTVNCGHDVLDRLAAVRLKASPETNVVRIFRNCYLSWHEAAYLITSSFYGRIRNAAEFARADRLRRGESDRTDCLSAEVVREYFQLSLDDVGVWDDGFDALDDIQAFDWNELTAGMRTEQLLWKAAAGTEDPKSGHLKKNKPPDDVRAVEKMLSSRKWAGKDVIEVCRAYVRRKDPRLSQDAVESAAQALDRKRRRYNPME